MRRDAGVYYVQYYILHRIAHVYLVGVDLDTEAQSFSCTFNDVLAFRLQCEFISTPSLFTREVEIIG